MLGHAHCRVCGALNGSLELTDGTFSWPEGLAHYLEEHGVRLPPRFVEHARRTTERLEDAEIDEVWWRRSSGGNPR